MYKRIFMLLFCLCGFVSCMKTTNWVEGGLYATPEKKGGYAILKILKLDDHGVHIRKYSNVFQTLPNTVDESSLHISGMDRKPDEALGMGHLPISKKSFVSWNVIFIQQSTVSPDELDGYEMWREAGGGYF
jgi:hypothetical protein